MDYVALRALIETHPDYPTPSDAELALWCNDETAITRDQSNISSAGIFDVCMNNDAEWRALADADAQIVRDILVVHAPAGVPTAAGEPARNQLVAILGTATKAEIAALIPETVSRAVDAGIGGKVREGDVTIARTA